VDQRVSTRYAGDTWPASLRPVGIYVKNVEIGDGKFDSIWTTMDEQVASFCETLASDPLLRTADSINMIGYSQGGLITRGYVQRCNDPPVHNLITWSSPHGGQFGVPYVGSWIDGVVAAAPYIEIMQEHVSFATYWRE
jgi:palmitoyl-protein thioesterase